MDIRGLLIGIIAGLTVFFAFQTKVLYPDWVLSMWQHPWILVLLAIVGISIYRWSPEVSVMFLLCLAAVIGDKLVFAREIKKVKHDNNLINTPHSTELPIDNFEDTASDEFYGQPLASLPIEEPAYPTFYGLDEPQPGPAPF